jgi:hypothetical protein
MNRRVYETVARKRACEGPLEPGEAELERQLASKGWHTRGYLPHYDKPGTLQMLTFRLADAMPAGRRHEREALRRIEDERERRTKIEFVIGRLKLCATHGCHSNSGPEPEGTARVKPPSSYLTASCKPVASQALGRRHRILFVFSWYSLGILLVFSSHFPLVLPPGLGRVCGIPNEPMAWVDSARWAGIQMKTHFSRELRAAFPDSSNPLMEQKCHL